MDEGDDDHHSSYTKTLQLFVSGFDGVCLCLFRFQSDGNCVSSREGVRFEGFRRRFGQRKPICGECDASKRKQAKIFGVLFLHSSPHQPNLFRIRTTAGFLREGSRRGRSVAH